MTESYLITGGAGFIGTNLADHYLRREHHVVIFDDFSRAGSEINVQWLLERHGDRVQIVRGDVRRDTQELAALCEMVDVVFHQAAQVAVTSSVADPRTDFETNALGTFNVLEAVRLSSTRPVLVYSSTNKVYGEMPGVAVVERNGRYTYAGLETGVDEQQPLDFHSPYGCSKGTGDQYVLDYARIYGLRTVVCRQSCIYGPRQFGIEDQGWVAWFAIRALQDLPITLFGDGKQVRDVLFIDDLITAYDAAIAHVQHSAGQAYNIGGGPANTLSLLELIDLLARRFGRPIQHRFAPPRPGDQLVYVSDVRKAGRDLGWSPRIGIEAGVDRLLEWLFANRAQVDRVMQAFGSPTLEMNTAASAD